MLAENPVSGAPVKATRHGQTRSGQLRETIEEQIATGELLPGTRLDEAELAVKFGVSRTPVREVLIQLSSQGILELRPRRGAIVPELSPQRLFEMFEVMAELESMCGRLAARRMSAVEHAALRQAHEACETAREAGDADGYYLQNEVFHRLIYAGSHNTFLAEQAAALHKRLRPHRRLQLRVRDRMATSYAEHQQVLDGIVAGNAEFTAECLRKHVIVQGERFGDLMAMLDRMEKAEGVRNHSK